ncbi:serine/threonine protein kinase regulatory subunit ATG13 NDAI_0J00170 [Naumovozyma dairenensis CBS 421]|uniref:Autophagy-related protein 13 n=1 Tax=Naumovozyma dairenensis (strain ATCC 10597 / BCRC 20456 / CBS 421 / NBRC 0211 / NRRL Y-12639) TaxID=1071378 RepID=G0WHC9_NAUDC|nr:hypothetical protein NDAI_0J00170 [Naumovozyma dairenensis CBS 421]CCD26909.1 hypothetical protein NDAI_0J00170 [Naumovozyma dairenensis CBS 421]
MVSTPSDQETTQLIKSFFVKGSLLICSEDIHNQQISNNDNNTKFNDDWFNSADVSPTPLPSIINQWYTPENDKTLPPLIIETYLDLRQLPHSYSIKLKDNDANLWNVTKGNRKTEIVLERWLLELDDTSPTFKSYKASEEEVSDSAKQLVLLLRYLYTLLQLLPVHDLRDNLSKQVNATKSLVGVKTRIVDGSKPILSKGRIGLSKPIITSYSNVINESNIPIHLQQKKITPVWTKFGLLRVSVSYRKDCHFIVQDSQEKILNKETFDINAKRSLSLSPRTKTHLGISPDSNLSSLSQRKRTFSGSKPIIQPFKVGSLSNATSRNPSHSSVLLRRTSISPAAAAGPHYIQQQQQQQQQQQALPLPLPTSHFEGTSVDSTSKYSSSFGKIRRHSSLKKSLENSILKRDESSPAIGTSDNSQKNLNSSDDLLEFVKLLEEKPKLNVYKIKNKMIKNEDISNSLIRFQNLKPNNDLLTEDLSASVSMDPERRRISGTHSQSRLNSQSNSPNPSLTFQGLYNKINNNINKGSSPSHLFIRSNSNVFNSRASSYERKQQQQQQQQQPTATILPPIYGEESMVGDLRSSSLPPNEQIMTIQDNDDNDVEKFMIEGNNNNNNNTKYYKSFLPPRSIDSIPELYSSNRMSFGKQQQNNYSQPTIDKNSVQAIMHKPNIRSTEILSTHTNKKIEDLLEEEDDGDNINHDSSTPNNITNNNRNHSNNNNNDSTSNSKDDGQEEDDDLLFFMSDMNLAGS